MIIQGKLRDYATVKNLKKDPIQSGTCYKTKIVSLL